jgi:hypothetical protein
MAGQSIGASKAELVAERLARQQNEKLAAACLVEKGAHSK